MRSKEVHCSSVDTPTKHLFAGGPYIMGVLNVTPDSFSDGGEFFSPDKAIERGLRMVEEGAHILDVGGESTRPGAQIIDPAEEIKRIVPVIEGLRGKAKYISVDTRNAATMEAALKAGANAINDISALTHDARSVSVAAEAKVPIFMMHMQGSPQTMQKYPIYKNVLEEVFQFLQSRIAHCDTHRIDTNLIVCDVGIGFGKTVEQNLLLLRNISRFHDLSVPLLLGVSRKSFIAKLGGGENPQDRLAGSLAGALWGLSQKVQVYRVHDVQETIHTFRVFEAIQQADALTACG